MNNDNNNDTDTTYPISEPYGTARIAVTGDDHDVIVAYGGYGADAPALEAEVARLPADVQKAITATYPCDRSMATFLNCTLGAPRRWGLADGVAYVDDAEWLDDVYGPGWAWGCADEWEYRVHWDDGISIVCDLVNRRNGMATCVLRPDADPDTESDGCGVWGWYAHEDLDWPDWETARAKILSDPERRHDAYWLLCNVAEHEDIDTWVWQTEYVDGEWLQRAPGWIASYGDGAAEISYPCAETAREAAQEYAESDDLVDRHETQYLDVKVWRAVYAGSGLGARDETTVTIRIEPDEPDCADGHDHDWRSPYAVLGGLKENPGVWGRGAGVVVREVCRHCGTYRVTDTSGDHGETIEYEDADGDSLAWVSSLGNQVNNG